MKKLRLCMFSLLLILSMPALAGVIEAPNVTIGNSSYETFQDDTTSLIWLDLDSFWDDTTTYNSLVTLLAGSGFRLATASDLALLEASMPAIPANFAAEVVIVGGNYTSRNLMWGIYEDGNSSDGVSYSYRYGTDNAWQYSYNIVSPTEVFSNHNQTERDLGAWVVADESRPVEPVPTLNWLGIAALVFMLTGFVYYRHRKVMS